MTELLDRTSASPFTYSNLNERPHGPLVVGLSPLLPGVRHVMSQVPAYADWWRHSNRRALASGAPLWVVLGDSLSQGIGASSPELGWVGRVAADPPAHLRDVAVLNLSFNGARVRDVLERQLPVHDVLRQHHDIALVTLLIGNNDLMSPRACRELSRTATRLLELVPDGTVVAIQPGLQRSAVAFNRVVHAAALRRDVRPADFRIPHLRDFVGRLGRDFFHPSDRGHAQMADAARASLRAVSRTGRR